MAHQIYHVEYLGKLPLSKLKEIANQLGTKPAIDRRYKSSWVVCIVRKQEEVIQIESAIDTLCSWMDQGSNDEEQFSELCCDALSLRIVDLELAYGGVVIPDGIPSIEVYDDSKQRPKLLGAITKHPIKDTYLTVKGEYNDIPTAALGFCQPKDVLFAKKTALKQMERMRLMPDYI